MSRLRQTAEKSSDAAPRTTSTERAPSQSQTPRLESLAGNFAMQRFVQAKLRVGSADDPQERAADRVAESVTNCGGGCSSAAPCASCAGEPRVRRKESAGAAHADTWLPERSLSRLGAGAPLDAGLRALLQPRFGGDLGRVRVHTGGAAAASARSIQARAFTSGRDVVFDEGEYQPQTPAGRKLIAHELAHVEQNEEPVRRVVNGDVRQMSITAGWARDLTDEELRDQVNIVRVQFTTAAQGSPEHAAAEGNLPILEEEVRRRGSASGDENALPDSIPVGLTFQLVGMQGGNGQLQQIPPDVALTLQGLVGGGGGVASPLAYAGVGGAGTQTMLGGPGPGGFVGSNDPGAAQFLGGGSEAAGYSLLRFVDPLPAGNSIFATSPYGAGTDIYTRFAGPTSGEGLLSGRGFNLNPDLRPRFYSGTPEELLRAEALYRNAGVSYQDLRALREILRRPGGFANLGAEEAELLRRVTQVHAEIAGATPTSPLLSLTELDPQAALRVFRANAASSEGIGTVTARTYVVRVRINPGDVARVNQVLQRAGSEAGLAQELEVVVAQDLARGAPQIVSITRNPSAAAPLGGAAGGALMWIGRGLIVLGAALTVAQVVTASGPHRRETEGRAFGSFAGATVLGAFGAGFCVGAGIATGGIALILCAGAFGAAGMFGGGALGGAVGRAFD